MTEFSSLKVINHFRNVRNVASQSTLPDHFWIKLSGGSLFVNSQVDWLGGPLNRLQGVIHNGSIAKERKK